MTLLYLILLSCNFTAAVGREDIVPHNLLDLFTFMHRNMSHTHQFFFHTDFCQS